MVQSAYNNIIVTISAKWLKNFTDIMRNAQIAESKLNPADLVQVVGDVVSIPKKIADRLDYKGFGVDGIKVGDVAIFRFDVIFNFLKQPAKDTPVYKNELFYKGKSYWNVDVQKLFAVIRDGEIIMQNGYVMVEDFGEQSAIILPQHMKKIIKTVSVKVIHIGKPKTNEKELGVKQFDTVYFHPKLAQHYRIGEKKFAIIKQSQILGFELSN